MQGLRSIGHINRHTPKSNKLTYRDQKRDNSVVEHWPHHRENLDLNPGPAGLLLLLTFILANKNRPHHKVEHSY